MPAASAALALADAVFVRDLVYKRAAIFLDETKDYLIEARLQQLAMDIQVPSIAELVKRARGGQGGFDTRIIEAITTHETLFFRDVHPFEMLRKTVLPELMAARQRTRTLSVWSAACSTGQEPYSLAMLLAESFPELARWPVRITATDLSEQILTRARAGSFLQSEINRGLPAKYLVKYFDQVGHNWVIKQEIKNLIRFQQQNLCAPWEPSLRPDIVFLRNVLIYFDNATKTTILGRLRQIMPKDGVLLLGGSETTLNLDSNWERVSVGPAAYYRVIS